jgi:DNA (cytosine-5)-methyltransferase 1
LSDLPEIGNEIGNKGSKPYQVEPKSHFQRLVRWEAEEKTFMDKVDDHICKNMKDLMVLRLSLIPKHFGADWRDLPNKIIELPDGTVTKLLKYRYKDYEKDIPAVCSCATAKNAVSTYI